MQLESVPEMESFLLKIYRQSASRISVSIESIVSIFCMLTRGNKRLCHEAACRRRRRYWTKYSGPRLRRLSAIERFNQVRSVTSITVRPEC